MFLGAVPRLAKQLESWLQLWLQVTAFAVVPTCSLSYVPAGHELYGTVADRLERDHDGLAVWRQESTAKVRRTCVSPMAH
jgi:hypothetical protein